MGWDYRAEVLNKKLSKTAKAVWYATYVYMGLTPNKHKVRRMIDITDRVFQKYFYWDITPCSSLSVNRRFGGTYRLHLQRRRNKSSKKPASKPTDGTSYRGARGTCHTVQPLPTSWHDILLIVSCTL
jgi:hypothetical protein